MSQDQFLLSDYMEHILEALDKIERYTRDMNQQAFLGNELVQDAAIRNIEIIGEASNSIRKRHPEFVAAHPELELSFAYQMRNALMHGYPDVDLEIVWKTIRNDLPLFRDRIREARSALSGPQP